MREEIKDIFNEELLGGDHMLIVNLAQQQDRGQAPQCPPYLVGLGDINTQ